MSKKETNKNQKVNKKPVVKKNLPSKKTNVPLKKANVPLKNTNVPLKKTDNSKKVPPKKVVTETKVSETLAAPEKEIFKDNLDANKCRFCGKYFDKVLTVCPHCNRDQKDNLGKGIIVSLLILLLLAIMTNHFIEKQLDNQVSEAEYKQNSALVSYEELVRNSKKYKGDTVKVIGKVVSVIGDDTNSGNQMTITIDANLFEGNHSQLIEVKFLDRNYEIGLLEGDLITVYGLYKAINGNVPLVESKYIAFGT